MLQIAAIAVAGWLLLCASGLAVVVCLRRPLQELVAPAIPAIGAATLVVALHWPALVTGTNLGLPISLGAAALALVVMWRRGGVHLPSRATIIVALGVSVLGVIPLAFALRPVTELGRPRLVQPSSNNDAFAYVSLTAWVANHSLLERPSMQSIPPAYAYADFHVTYGLRAGEELVQASIAEATHHDPASTWFIVACLWLLVLPGSCAAAVRVLGGSTATGLGAGLIVALSAVMFGQLSAQNSAALLGVAVAPLAIALLVDGLKPERLAPAWLAGGLLAGLAGSYSEYLPLLAPGLLVVLVARRPAAWPVAARRALTIGALAFAIAPLVWFNVVRSLLHSSGIDDPSLGSAFLHVPAWAIVNRVTGASGLEAGMRPALAGGFVFVTLVGGVVLALANARSRPVALTALGAGAVMLALSTVHPFAYGQQRAVQVGVPLALIASAFGYGVTVEALRGRRVFPLALALAVVTGGAVVVINTRTSWRAHPERVAAGRTIDDDILAAAGWVRDLGGADGRNAMVIDTGFFPQLWVTYELRSRPRVAYPILFRDYFQIDPYARWDGTPRRYALVGRADYVLADPGVVIRANERYVLLDMSRGRATIVAPTLQFAQSEVGPEGIAHWMANDGELLVVRSPNASTDLTLRGAALSDLAPLPLEVKTAEGEPVASFTVPGSISDLPIRLPDRPGLRLILVNGTPARPPASGEDPRDLAFYLAGVGGD